MPFEFMGFMFEFIAVVVVLVFVAPVAPLTCVLVVVVIVVLALEFIAMFVFLVALVAVLLLAASPQAIPKAPSAKRVESAIIFLISKWTLLSFSKNITTYFYLLPPCERHCSRTVKFWNNRQYSHPAYISQPPYRLNIRFIRDNLRV